MRAYSLTIFGGAFLLFQVQPLIGRYILPWFGGSSAVWTICMLFFQVFLLAGYAYAHFSIRNLSGRAQAGLHLGLMALSLALLPIIPGEHLKPDPQTEPTLEILLLLAITIGLPYFVLAATSPLLQAWHYREFPGRSPYRLYSLSNIGSLLALGSYPFLIEPSLSRKMQAIVWSCGFGLYALACGFCAVRIWRFKPVRGSQTAPGGTADPGAQRTPLSTRVLWLVYPACAVTLLLAVTSHICLDVAVIPFLWILPLALYLVTFIITFNSERWYSRKWFTRAMCLSLVIIAILLFKGEKVSIVTQVAGFGFVMFAGCMVCHGELYRIRPSSGQLTRFYLMIAAGGALGGFAVGILAPAIFNDYYELQGGFLLCFFLLMGVLYFDRESPLRQGRRRVAWAGLMLVFFGSWGAMLLQARGENENVIAKSRSFYGALSVLLERRNEPLRTTLALKHGRIVHGEQFTYPGNRRYATTYYTPYSGVGRALLSMEKEAGRKLGFIGMGAGTLATYGLEDDVIRFYEINPSVILYALRDFSFIRESPSIIEFALGDARLSLEKEESQQFDLLVIDAFTGDAIPTHLLTKEAFEIYLRHLKPDGVLAVHVTNRHLDLRPIVASLAEHFGLESVIVEDVEAPYSSDWVLSTRDPAFFEHELIKEVAGQFTTAAKSHRLWTDDNSNLAEILK